MLTLFLKFEDTVLGKLQIHQFLPRNASAERSNATVSRLSVCLSVCP